MPFEKLLLCELERIGREVQDLDSFDIDILRERAYARLEYYLQFPPVIQWRLPQSLHFLAIEMLLHLIS